MILVVLLYFHYKLQRHNITGTLSCLLKRVILLPKICFPVIIKYCLLFLSLQVNELTCKKKTETDRIRRMKKQRIPHNSFGRCAATNILFLTNITTFIKYQSIIYNHVPRFLSHIFVEKIYTVELILNQNIWRGYGYFLMYDAF